MSLRGFKNNPEFLDLIRICTKRRLTYEEAVIVIRRSGFKISARTYQRRKGEIKKSDKNRLEYLAAVEYPEFTVDTIDTAKAVEAQLWEIAKTAKTDWERMAALEKIMKYRKEIAQFYDSSPVVDALRKKLQDGNVGNDRKESNYLEKHSETDKL